MENVEMDELKNPKAKNNIISYIPVAKRARTKNLAFLFQMAARLLQQNSQLVICINFASNSYFLSKNEVIYLKKLYSNWLLAYVKGYTNEKPSYKGLAERSGYTYNQIQSALQNKVSRGYTLTYELMKQWGYIYEC